MPLFKKTFKDRNLISNTNGKKVKKVYKRLLFLVSKLFIFFIDPFIIVIKLSNTKADSHFSHYFLLKNSRSFYLFSVNILSAASRWILVHRSVDINTPIGGY